MFLYLLSAAIGYVLCRLLFSPDTIYRAIVKEVKAGKRVVICVDNTAYIMTLVDGRVKSIKGIVDYNPEPIDQEEVDANDLDNRNFN